MICSEEMWRKLITAGENSWAVQPSITQPDVALHIFIGNSIRINLFPFTAVHKKNNVSVCELINHAIRSPQQKIGHVIDSHGQMDTQCLKISDIKGATFAQQKAGLLEKWRFLSPLGDERECPQLTLEIRTEIW